MPATPPPIVTVAEPIQREVTDYQEYTGQTASVDSVQVRARVSGYLDKIHFKDGADIKEGEVLYEIDPRPYKAALDQAEAQIKLQEAQAKYQESVYNRDLKLIGTGAVTQEELQKDLAARDNARAAVNAAKANAELARLNLSFTKILSPITGQLSRTLVTRGNLVIADQTLLTTIVSLDPMYVYFEVDEQTMLTVRELIREGKLQSVREGASIPVFLGLANEQGFPHQGLIDFVNNQVNPTTGTLQVRGVFANPKPPKGYRLLSPGLFVRVRVPVSPLYQALLVIQSAIGTDQNLRFIYVLDDKNQVVRRDVKLGTEQGPLQVISEGLKPGERVIINGLQHVRPGIAVNPKVTSMDTASLLGQETGANGQEAGTGGQGAKKSRGGA